MEAISIGSDPGSLCKKETSCEKVKCNVKICTGRSKATNQSLESNDTIIAVRVTILNLYDITKVCRNLKSAIGLHPLIFRDKKVLGT